MSPNHQFQATYLPPLRSGKSAPELGRSASLCSLPLGVGVAEKTTLGAALPVLRRLHQTMPIRAAPLSDQQVLVGIFLGVKTFVEPNEATRVFAFSHWLLHRRPAPNHALQATLLRNALELNRWAS